MTKEDLRVLQTETSISAMFSLQHTKCHDYWSIDYPAMRKEGEDLGFAMRWHPIRDFDVEHMRERLPCAVSGLASLREAGHTVYVHCTAGLGRAPLTVLGYLAMVEQVDPEAAIQWILKGRPGACPAWEAFHGAREDLVNLHRREIEWRAYDLYEQTGNPDAHANWVQAEADVLKKVLSGSAARNEFVA